MAPSPSLRVIKDMPFKGGTRAWSTRYHFNGGTPADATHWHTLMDNVVAGEKAALLTNHTIVQAIGYAAGSDVPVASKTYTTAGTHTKVGAEAPGECAAIIRWSTSKRSVKNHPVYGFNYMHGCDIGTTTGQADLLYSGYKTALSSYFAAWITGFSDGSITATRALPDGTSCSGVTVEEYVSHRDFPYTTSL